MIISKTDALNVATKQHGEDTKWLQIDPNDNERWQGEFKKQSGHLGDLPVKHFSEINN